MLRDGEECPMKLKAEIGAVQPPASGHPGWSGANKSWERQGSVLPKVSAGAWTLLITRCAFLVFRIIREKVSVFAKPPSAQCVVICYSSHGKPIHHQLLPLCPFPCFPLTRTRSLQEADSYSSLGFLQHSALTWRHLLLFCICCKKKIDVLLVINFHLKPLWKNGKFIRNPEKVWMEEMSNYVLFTSYYCSSLMIEAFSINFRFSLNYAGRFIFFRNSLHL